MSLENKKHLSKYYFDNEKRHLLDTSDIFIFSKVVEFANDLILKISSLDSNSNIRDLKIQEIKNKILNCSNLDTALEYYSDFEFEINKINLDGLKSLTLDPIKEVSTEEITETSSDLIIEPTSLTSKTDNSEDLILTIDTNSSFVSMSNKLNNVQSKKKNTSNLEKVEKNIQYYVNKYSKYTNANEDYVLDVIASL